MKKYIILSGSVDGATCEDDGFLNCANFDLVGSRACDSLEEAIEVMNQTIEQDKAAFAEGLMLNKNYCLLSEKILYTESLSNYGISFQNAYNRASGEYLNTKYGVKANDYATSTCSIRNKEIKLL